MATTAQTCMKNEEENKYLEKIITICKKRKLTDNKYYYLTKKKNLKEAARNLYKTLRTIKKRNFKSIAIEKIPNTGFGQAINDRLIRASKT